MLYRGPRQLCPAFKCSKTSRYQSNIPGQCSPGDGTQLIVYTKFVSDIEAVFTVEELEKKPCTTRVAEVRPVLICSSLGLMLVGRGG